MQAEAQQQFRRTPEDIARLYVRGRDNEMIPVSSLVKTEFRSGPTQLLRFNGFGSAYFTGTPKPGRRAARMKETISSWPSSSSRRASASHTGARSRARRDGPGWLVFAPAGIVFPCSRRNTSWAILFAVLLASRSDAGALLHLAPRNAERHLFQVGPITVVGLAAKNAILIVEFANEMRRGGSARPRRGGTRAVPADSSRRRSRSSLALRRW